MSKNNDFPLFEDEESVRTEFKRSNEQRWDKVELFQAYAKIVDEALVQAEEKVGSLSLWCTINDFSKEDFADLQNALKNLALYILVEQNEGMAKVQLDTPIIIQTMTKMAIQKLDSTFILSQFANIFLVKYLEELSYNSEADLMFDVIAKEYPHYWQKLSAGFQMPQPFAKFYRISVGQIMAYLLETMKGRKKRK
jgi:hypothetical protein